MRSRDEINLAPTQALPVEEISIAANISRVPVTSVVTAETTKFLGCPSIVLVALPVQSHRVGGAIKALSNLPTSLSVIADDTGGRCGGRRGRLR